jgi:exodeoxyribonuclease V beta subunit
VKEAIRPGESVSLPEHFPAFAALMQALDRFPPLTGRLRSCTAARIACSGWRSRRLQAGSFRLRRHAEPARHRAGPAVNAMRLDWLRARIRTQYPVALIDEFQDTSPVQSRIFDRVYGIAETTPTPRCC